MYERPIVTRQLPPLNSLISFEVAARHLSFTKAASELNMTQGAISKQIINLEYQLGVKLFHRRTRSLELTGEGQLFWPQVHEAVELLQRATAELLPEPGRAQIEVRVPPTLAMRWLIPRLQSFRGSHPKVDLRLRTSLGATLAEFNLHRDQIDIAVVRLRKDGREDVPMSDYLMDDDHVVVCTRAVAESLSSAPTALSQQTLLHSVTRKSAWKAWLSTAGISSVDPEQGLFFDHYHFTLQAAADGIGVAVAPYPLVEEYLRTGRLVIPFDIAAASGSAYFLVYDRKTSRDQNVRAFRDWILEEAELMRVLNSAMLTVDGRELKCL